MKNGPVLFLGLFAALTVSWGAIVLGSHRQLGTLTPYYDDTEGNAFPQRASGIAAQGEREYISLGCVACHTQQVRRPDFGADQARGWGDRQSVARDYIYQFRPQLGSIRFGPDLANLAARKPSAPSADDLLKMLYAGTPAHPGYRFLFEKHKIVGERSERALNLTDELAPKAGYEIIPSEKAEALVAYLLSLKNGYEYPEARPVETAASEGAEPAAAKPAGNSGKAPNTEPSPETEKSNPPGKRPEQAVPAAAPDENKKQTK
jgi:cytochrome c oxidase cbb3-type subunit 2